MTVANGLPNHWTAGLKLVCTYNLTKEVIWSMLEPQVGGGGGGGGGGGEGTF